ncbi:MAG: hypothetical protein KJN80_09150 [Deltaproteobacteria bacterium]|nr:hypothetical protein [Deltaproteobacteria bacterium]
MFRFGKNFQSLSFAFTNREGYDISSNEETFDRLCHVPQTYLSLPHATSQTGVLETDYFNFYELI